MRQKNTWREGLNLPVLSTQRGRVPSNFKDVEFSGFRDLIVNDEGR